jgi:hypothetical protein
VDSYVNGSQTWFVGEPVLEWRLHPVAAFRQPPGCGPYDLWDGVVGALSAGADPAALPVGEGTVALADLWEGMECFPAYDDEIEPVALLQRCAELLPVPPDLHGLVDHDAIGDAWERAEGDVSIVTLLEQQLAG